MNAKERRTKLAGGIERICANLAELIAVLEAGTETDEKTEGRTHATAVSESRTDTDTAGPEDEKVYTYEEARKILVPLCNKIGIGTFKEILKRHGLTKLSDAEDPKLYGILIKETEEICNEES